MPGLITLLPKETIEVWPAAFAFLVGGIVNSTGLPKIRDGFARLGFPGWWCWITGALEIAAALLVLVTASRTIGIILGACIMLAALAAIFRQKAYSHLPPPILFLIFLVIASFSHADLN